MNQTGKLIEDQMKYLAHIKDKKVLASPHIQSPQSSYYYSHFKKKLLREGSDKEQKALFFLKLPGGQLQVLQDSL